MYLQDAVTCVVQVNNAYVFPAIGFAAVLARAATISDDVFLTAAETLSHMSSPEVQCSDFV